MFESSSGGFSASPTLLLSQINDPALLTTLCAPFLHSEVSADAFCLHFVTSTLVPRVQQAICSHSFPVLQNLPKLIRLIVDNYDSEGLDLVVADLLRPLARGYSPESPDSLNLYLDAVSSVPSRFRDRVLVDLVNEYYASDDPTLRILAANTATLVRKQRFVASQFQTLSTDDNEIVRAEGVKLLRNCHFDGPLIESILSNAAADSSEIVQRAAAAVFGEVAPLFVDLYIRLLENSVTMETALDSFISVARYSGFAAVAAAFSKAISVYPKKCARVLVEVSEAADPSDHLPLYSAALQLRHCPSFIKKLHEFSAPFEAKRPFRKFFKVETMKTPRERLLYARQAILFVPILGPDLLTAALAFAHDESPTVRFQSVGVLAELCRNDPALSAPISSLMRSAAEQRLVLAQVIVAVGPPTPFEKVARMLQREVGATLRNSIDEMLRHPATARQPDKLDA
jgi:hypothetical protein